MSFVDLKKARSARHAAAITRAVDVKPVAATPPADLESRTGGISSDTSGFYEDREGYYANLGESLEIRVNEMGRGIYVKREAKEPIRAGVWPTLCELEAGVNRLISWRH
jgi:hypothetical protein